MYSNNKAKMCMKINNKRLFLIVTTFIVGTMLSSCSKNEMGTPSVSYIRVTNPAVSDSLLASASQGQMIAIMGQNLQSVTEIWFNDQKAQIIPTFITGTSVITHVPSGLPLVITDKMKMIFANGSSLDYDFSVDISKPRIDHVRTEYINSGDSLFIYGDYFYKPLVVSLTGGAQAEILSVSADAKTIIAKMPTGVQPGPLTITSNFGAKASDFWMQDNRNFIASFDIPLVNYIWKGYDYIVSSDPVIPNINGKFTRVNKGKLSGYPFLEIYGGPAQGGDGDIAKETKNIPAEAFTNPNGYSLKFEVNTLQSLTGANMRLYLGGADNGTFDAARQASYYTWKPNLNTHGVWVTITIPFSDVLAANNQTSYTFKYDVNGYGMFIYWHGPDPATYNYAMDNMRVVPNK
jgi:hypothetical protein